VQRQIDTLEPEIASFKEDTLQAILRLGDLRLMIWDGYEDGSLVWGLFDRLSLVGVGTFIHIGNALVAGNQAILKPYQKKGVYRRVIDFVRSYAGPLPVQSGGEQTEASGSFWKKLGGVDRGDYYELPPLDH